jgi:hypothetical protein
VRAHLWIFRTWPRTRGNPSPWCHLFVVCHGHAKALAQPHRQAKILCHGVIEEVVHRQAVKPMSSRARDEVLVRRCAWEVASFLLPEEILRWSQIIVSFFRVIIRRKLPCPLAYNIKITNSVAAQNSPHDPNCSHTKFSLTQSSYMRSWRQPNAKKREVADLQTISVGVTLALPTSSRVLTSSAHTVPGFLLDIAMSNSSSCNHLHPKLFCIPQCKKLM